MNCIPERRTIRRPRGTCRDASSACGRPKEEKLSVEAKFPQQKKITHHSPGLVVVQVGQGRRPGPPPLGRVQKLLGDLDRNEDGESCLKKQNRTLYVATSKSFGDGKTFRNAFFSLTHLAAKVEVVAAPAPLPPLLCKIRPNVINFRTYTSWKTVLELTSLCEPGVAPAVAKVPLRAVLCEGVCDPRRHHRVEEGALAVDAQRGPGGGGGGAERKKPCFKRLYGNMYVRLQK